MVINEAGQLLGPVTKVAVSTVDKDYFYVTSLEESLSKYLTEEQVMRVSILVKEYADVFALDSSELGSTNLVTYLRPSGIGIVYSDFSCAFSLEADTSGAGLGAVLTQKQADGST